MSPPSYNYYMITTSRLALIPATVTLARAELADRGELARLLAAAIPENWPPESTADALPLFLSWLEAAPDRVGWFGWYALARTDDVDVPVLVGGGGFLGRQKAAWCEWVTRCSRSFSVGDMQRKWYAG